MSGAAADSPEEVPPGPRQHPLTAWLASELEQAEAAVYTSTDGIAERAVEIAELARSLGDRFTADRAELLRSDIASRRGDFDEAFPLQREIRERARRAGDPLIVARAACLLATTYYRMGMATESCAAAEEGYRLLDDSAPALWHVHHQAVLALFTTHDRSGAIDFELFEESLRRARAYGEPQIRLAILNNYAYTATEADGELPRAEALADEMAQMITGGEAPGATTVYDTIGWVYVLCERFDDAERWLGRAMTAAQMVEPDDDLAVSLHLAELRVRQGHGRRARSTLEWVRRAAFARATPDVTPEALRALAELDAAEGDHRRAYRRMVRYVSELRGAERAASERRAETLQTLHGTEIERDQRRYYQELAIRDPLTSLFNRRHLMAELPLMLESEPAMSIAVAMVDVDHFKQINDAHTHAAGDAVLRRLAELLEEHCAALARDGFVARLGGEEFVIVAPGLDAEQALASLDRLREEIAAAPWPTVPAAAPTVSIGVAVRIAGHTTASDLLALADEGVYEAKRRGRNRVCVAAPLDGAGALPVAPG